MKKIITLLLTLSIIILCSANVFATENHVFLGKENDIFDSSEIKMMNDDLDYILENFDIDFKLVYDYSIPNDELAQYSENLLENSNGIYRVALCINEDYYYFAYSENCISLLGGHEEQLWSLHLNEDTYFEGFKKIYQEVVRVINEEFYESNIILVSGTPKIYDNANLLNETELKEIEKKLADVSKKYSIDIVVLFTDSLNGMTARNYADDYYDYNGYRNNGILFMLSMNEREWYVSTKGNAILYISDNTIDTIVDGILDDLSSGHYSDALNKYVNKLDKALEHGINNNGKDYHETNYTQVLLTSGGIAAVVTLIVYLVLNGQLKSVRTNSYAGDYIVPNSFRLTGYSDFFIRKEVSKTAKQSSSSSSGSHSSHTSSSGSSHGGHGGRF